MTSEEGDTSTLATIIKRIRNAEITRRAWQKCDHVARGKVYSGGLNNLEVPRDPAVTPKECQDWLYIEDPDLIETHLQSHLRTHFAQAEETDFRQSPLKEDTNFSADTPTADNILKGDTSEYDTAQLRLSTAMLLQHMAMVTDKEITTTLTDKQFDGKLKTWNEQTTTSPFGDKCFIPRSPEGTQRGQYIHVALVNTLTPDKAIRNSKLFLFSFIVLITKPKSLTCQ
jgi:hypothetical protein